jgi:Tol biopolymer transport system component
VLADAALGRGGSWSRDDVIIFTPNPNIGIWRVPAAGGAPSPVTRIGADRASDTHVYPQFLADGRRFIYYSRSDQRELQGIYVRTLDSEESTLISRNDGLAVYASGYLLVVRDGSLFAQPVDDATMQTRGDPVHIADGIGFTLGTSGYSPISAAGSTLAFGPSVRTPTTLQWRDRTGAAGAILARGEYRSPRLSLDGQRVALTWLEERATSPDIWILEIARGTFTRVSYDPATDWFPVWAPDGERLFFGSARSRATTLYQKDLRGTSKEEALYLAAVARYPVDATSDERLVFHAGGAGGGGYDLGMMNLKEGRTPVLLLASPFSEVQARVAPNSRWIAYASDESGRFEVYVRGFPSMGGQWTMSPAGGMQPEWRRDGRELFYISRDRKLMAVPVTTDGGNFSAGVPRALFDVDLPEPSAPYPTDYAVSADGQRFLLNTLVDQPSRPPLTVVLNWMLGLSK